MTIVSPIFTQLLSGKELDALLCLLINLAALLGGRLPSKQWLSV